MDQNPIPNPAGVNGTVEAVVPPVVADGADTKVNNNNGQLVPVEPGPSTSTPAHPAVDKSILFTSPVFKDPDDFEAFRMAEVYCDLELRFYTQMAVFAHKIVLGKRNAYFSRKLAAQPDCTYLEMAHTVNAEYLELLIKYIYTGRLKITISPKNLIQLMAAAAEFEVNEINLISAASLLKDKICPKTCWLIKEVARELAMEALIIQMDNWMKRNFVAIVAVPEFLNVEFDDVLSLIQNASRKRTSEIEIFEGILKWVEHEESRKDRLFDLIKTLNMEAIFNADSDLLKEKFREGSLLDKDVNCCRMFDQICRKKAFEYDARLKNNELDQTLALPSPVPSPIQSPRRISLPKSLRINITPVDTVQTQFNSAKRSDSDRPLRMNKRPVASSSRNNGAVGGYESDSASSVTSDVQLLTKKPKNTPKRATVSFQNHFRDYVNTNGGNGNTEMKILNFRKKATTTYFDVYNFHTNATEHLCQVRNPRKASSIVMVEDTLYHIGGEKARSFAAVGDVDIYHPSYKKGYKGPGPALVTPTKNSGVCLYNNAIYVMGGEGLVGNESHAHNLTQMLNLNVSKPSKQKWVLKRYMDNLRDSFGVSVLGNKMFVAGGFGTSFKGHKDTYPLKTVECYSAETEEWELLKESRLKVPRANVRLCAMDDKLYAVGGFHYETVVPASLTEEVDRNSIALNTVEMFEPTRGKDWTYIATMNEERQSGVVLTQNGLLYAIGGNYGPSPTAEFYDPRINMWQYLSWPSELPVPKDNVVDYQFAIPFP